MIWSGVISSGSMRRHSGRRHRHCALARGAVDDDVGRLVGAAVPLLYVVQIDIRSPQALHLDPPAFVVSHGPDVLRAQSQFAARHHGAGHLAAGTQHFVLKRNLAGIGGKVRHHQQSVGGVEPNAHHVKLRHHLIVKGAQAFPPLGCTGTREFESRRACRARPLLPRAPRRTDIHRRRGSA